MSQCIVCRVEVSRSSDAIVEFLTWESELGYVKKEATGRVAHIACWSGDRYDERQMTLADAIKEREKE